MSDLFYGQTCTEAYQCVSAGTAHTFKFKFQPDKVTVYNLSQWTGTAANKPISVWFRNQTVAAQAYQEQVIDSSAGASFNFLNTTTNGFTVADLPGGQATSHSTISAITKANPGVVTHSAFTFETNQVVRFTDLGACGVVQHGMNELNNQRFRIVVLSPTTFSMKDVISGEPIDTTSFTTYISGGILTLETHVISLNNPQVFPYSNLTPYNPNPYQYDPITYQLTAGTSVMGSNGNVLLVEVIKYGQVLNLGQLT